jgi:hypothetical protein
LLQPVTVWTDTCCVRHKKSPLDEIAGEYTEAMAAGEFERAAGWFAVARFVSAREDDAGDTNSSKAWRLVEVPRAAAGD